MWSDESVAVQEGRECGTLPVPIPRGGIGTLQFEPVVEHQIGTDQEDDPSAKRLGLRVDAGSFAAGARHVLYVRPWIQMRLSLNAALAAKFQHAIAQRT